VSVPPIVAEARTLRRDQFVDRHPGWFLVVSNRAEGSSLSFRTRVGEIESPSAPQPETVSEVLPVAKAPGNPYPDRISVGRARNCDVVLRDQSVSKLHAHFRERRDGSLELVDLQSQNGTRINDRRIQADAPEFMAPGDVVSFGSLAALFVDSDGLFDALQQP
jgi:hypothetical protein